MVPHCQLLQPAPSSPGGECTGRVVVGMEGATEGALPPTTAPGCKYCNVCKQLLDLGLETAPLGAAVGSAPQAGGTGGGSAGSACSCWVLTAWHVCCCGMLKWPIFPHLGAVTWEDPAGSQVWPLIEPSPGSRGAGGWMRAAVGA